MAYAPSFDLPGGQPITETSTVQKHPLGTRIRAIDPVYGESEFVYLKGVASTVAGSVVTFDQRNAATVLTTLSTLGLIAVAMSANVANQFGWYCVAGACSAKAAATVVSGAQAQLTANAGEVDDLAVAEKFIRGMNFASTSSGGFADVVLNHPSSSAG
jgi:hypothetical protein